MGSLFYFDSLSGNIFKLIKGDILMTSWNYEDLPELFKNLTGEQPTHMSLVILYILLRAIEFIFKQWGMIIISYICNRFRTKTWLSKEETMSLIRNSTLLKNSCRRHRFYPLEIS